MSRRNRRVATICAGVFFGMVGMSYAAVPLYDLLCRVTGLGGTTQRAEEAPDTIIERKITVRFDGNVTPGLGWEFAPEHRAVTMKMGETGQMAYVARNAGPAPSVGTSVFNVTPFEAAVYFNKLECFCFTEQPLAPGESVNMPVVFFVDPAMDKDPELKHVTEITLSYTFYPAETPVKPVAAKSDDAAAPNRL
ncbi:cytochrome c oxidase assembly protein [Pannonibacter tanglangensis]|nr:MULTISPECIES: cytochrome c oxidase assembly protein [unclassified Pannonibacter]